MREPGDLQRFEHLYTTAVDAKNAAAKEFNNEQVGAAASRKEYFEKLAFGSAAAIAAIVSFVGTHSRLWSLSLLRCIATFAFPPMHCRSAGICGWRQ